uniref:Secreted protein n=1 Tax=Caenorhabditis tropicalis TaxID=1561998 RepID=A0A1I7TID9_9PELO
MFFIFGNSAVQFVLVVILFCTIAVWSVIMHLFISKQHSSSSCMLIEKFVGCFFPIAQDEMQRIMAAQPRPAGRVPAPIPLQARASAPAALPHVVIQIDPPESDEEMHEMDEMNEMSQQETQILRSHDEEEAEITSL